MENLKKLKKTNLKTEYYKSRSDTHLLRFTTWVSLLGKDNTPVEYGITTIVSTLSNTEEFTNSDITVEAVLPEDNYIHNVAWYDEVWHLEPITKEEFNSSMEIALKSINYSNLV